MEKYGLTGDYAISGETLAVRFKTLIERLHQKTNLGVVVLVDEFILKLMGAHAQTEIHMTTGRADCVIKTPGYIYVFEFKLDKPVEDAMTQIEDSGYAILYTVDTRKLYKIGVVFSSEKRNVTDWKVEG